MSRYLQGTLPVYCLICHASNLHFNVQTLKMQFFVQGHWLIFPNSLVSRRLTFCFLHSGRCRIAGTVGCCCVLLRQSDICICGWDWRSWTLVSNCAFGVFYTGQQGLVGCRGNLSTTLQNENPAPGQPHNHAPSDTSIKYSKTRNAMKDLATNTRDKPRQIFAQVALVSRRLTFCFLHSDRCRIAGTVGCCCVLLR
jgi:hypothetical protein